MLSETMSPQIKDLLSSYLYEIARVVEPIKMKSRKLLHRLERGRIII